MITKFEGRYSFLSNFYAAQTLYEGILYPTSEAAYQAAKTINSDDRLKILSACTPDDAKHLGRHIQIRPDWEEVKDDVMYEIIKNKFKNRGLADKLLKTGDELLCEGNYWHDNYWGACECPKCRLLPRRNQLGKTLMKVREELKNGSSR